MTNIRVFCRSSVLIVVVALLLLGCSRTGEPTIPSLSAREQTAVQVTRRASNSDLQGLPATPQASGGEASQATATARQSPGLAGFQLTPVAPAHSLVGIEVHDLRPGMGLELVVESGAHWIRRNALVWSDVEQYEGQRNWQAVANLEEELEYAAQAGLETILIVRSTPRWAQAVRGSFCGPVLPEKREALAAFMGDVVARYSAPPYSVRYFELWNEPDVGSWLAPESVFGCWGEKGDTYFGGGSYADVLKAVYPRVKAANPQAQLLVGGLLLDCDPVNPPESPAGSGITADCTPSRYLEGILANSGGQFFDGVSFHAYDYFAGQLGAYGSPGWHSAWNVDGPVLIQKARFLRSVLAQQGYAEKYLLNTESALICGRDGSEPECQGEQFNLTKAYYAAQAFASALAEGLRANVWYSTTGWRGSGLFDGRLEPYPVYQAIQFTAQQLDEAGFVGELRQYPGVKGYQFMRADKPVWLMWSLDGEAHDIVLDQPPSAVFDVFGKSITPGQTMTVGIAPRWVEWDR